MQFTHEEVSKCKIFNAEPEEIARQFHCPNQAVIERKPKDLCLYNLFIAKGSLINQTCQVVVDKTKEHFVVKISGSQFQIFSKEPKSFYWTCDKADANHISNSQHQNVTGMFFFNLTDECPYAFTEDYQFILNKNIKFLKKVDLIPTTATNSYLKTLAENLNPSHVQKSVEPLLLNDNVQSGVPLRLVQSKLIQDQNPIEIFYKSLGYISFTISLIVLFCFSVICIKHLCCKNSLCKCKKSPHETDTYECDTYGNNCKDSEDCYNSYPFPATPSLNSIIKSNSFPPNRDYVPTWARE
jgi:hypothetical protein